MTAEQEIQAIINAAHSRGAGVINLIALTLARRIDRIERAQELDPQ